MRKGRTTAGYQTSILFRHWPKCVRSISCQKLELKGWSDLLFLNQILAYSDDNFASFRLYFIKAKFFNIWESSVLFLKGFVEIRVLISQSKVSEIVLFQYPDLTILSASVPKVLSSHPRDMFLCLGWNDPLSTHVWFISPRSREQILWKVTDVVMIQTLKILKWNSPEATKTSRFIIINISFII